MATTSTHRNSRNGRRVNSSSMHNTMPRIQPPLVLLRLHRPRPRLRHPLLHDCSYFLSFFIYLHGLFLYSTVREKDKRGVFKNSISSLSTIFWTKLVFQQCFNIMIVYHQRLHSPHCAYSLNCTVLRHECIFHPSSLSFRVRAAMAGSHLRFSCR